MKVTWHIKYWEALTADELYELLALRMQVFVVEQNCPYQDADGKDKKSLHLFATADDGTMYACARLVKPGVSYAEWSVGRVATSAQVRRAGLGRELMQRAMDYFKTEQNNPPIRISAQSYLQKFYEGYDFVCTGKEYMEDDIPHIEMLYTP
ncbi:MAG: GNAT family N-acetyltransferase [Flavobacteriales bacterium]